MFVMSSISKSLYLTQFCDICFLPTVKNFTTIICIDERPPFFSEVYWPFPFLSTLLKTQNGFLKGLPLQMWDCRIHTSAVTNPKHNLILFKRDHLPQEHKDEHLNLSGISLQVLTENCFIAQKDQGCNKSFWESLIFLTFSTFAVNSIL